MFPFCESSIRFTPAGHLRTTRYLRDSPAQSEGSEFDRSSLSSSALTQVSYLSLTSSAAAAAGDQIRERRSLRLKRRPFRLSTSISVHPVPISKIDHGVGGSSKSKHARRLNDSMVYLEGPHVYSCANCRIHLTSHDDIISKSFHGRRGRAYLFHTCVNITNGPSEQRRLITGLHTVCDIFCQRCETLLGWTYRKAYESNQKYKEGRFIVEKINLFAEESEDYDSMFLSDGAVLSSQRCTAMDAGDEEVFEYELPSM